MDRPMIGDVYADNGCEIELLGGPTRLALTNFTRPVRIWTFRWLWCNDPRLVGKAQVLREFDLDNMNWLRNTRNKVIHGHCPNCDEEDMIFYLEDYICAWCREHLEDAVC